MNKNQAKVLLPIIEAISEGKDIQYFNDYGWEDVLIISSPSLVNHPERYRIKPSPTYRPFANTEECWKEMLKHQPFGWVIKHKDEKELIVKTHWGGIQLHSQTGCFYDFDEANRILTFADGSVFGLKE